MNILRSKLDTRCFITKVQGFNLFIGLICKLGNVTQGSGMVSLGDYSQVVNSFVGRAISSPGWICLRATRVLTGFSVQR